MPTGMPACTAKEIAARVGGILVGCPTATVTGVAPLDGAGATDLAFLGKTTARYKAKVGPSLAPVVLVPRDFTDEPAEGRAFIQCDNPSALFTQFILACTPPDMVPPAGIHPSAVIGAGTTIPESAHIGANVTVGNNVELGEKTIILAGCVIGNGARIGSSCLLHPGVMVLDRCQLGNEVVIHAGTVIGSDGFGFMQEGGQHQKVPQVGIVQIDDKVEIGANCTIDRARFGKTWIQSNCIIDNLVQIGHNVVVEQGCIIIAQVGISGSTRICRGAILAGQVGIAGHLEIGAGAIVMAKSGIMADLEPGSQVMGIPAHPKGEFFREQVAIRKLPDLLRTVDRLEKRLAALEGNSGNS